MPVNYQDSKAYTIVNDINDILYVGSTAQPYLCSRWSGHKRNSKDVTKTSGIYTAMRTLGIDHFRIVLHHVFPCNSKDELVAEEFRTLDALISAGKSVYNNIINGKADDETKAKMAAAQKGNQSAFSFGSIGHYTDKLGNQEWKFSWMNNGTQRNKSFACKKYGDYGALWRAEQARREIYPEWGSEEDCTCDDFGEIEWEI